VDFAGEQLAVLLTAIIRFAFDMDKDPARVVAAYGIDRRFAHSRFRSWRSASLRTRRGTSMRVNVKPLTVLGVLGARLVQAAGGSLSGEFILEILPRFARRQL
jgi:hypothetical protein